MDDKKGGLGKEFTRNGGKEGRRVGGKEGASPSPSGGVGVQIGCGWASVGGLRLPLWTVGDVQIGCWASVGRLIIFLWLVGMCR